MPYIGKKPADIIATVIDTTTGTFSGEVDAGSLDVSGNADIDGITNLDNTDIDGTLDVSGEVITADDIKFTSGSRHKFVGGGTGNNLELGTYSSNNTSRDVHLQIDSAGNVGIGTSSPNFPLDVVSDSSANGIQLRGRSADNIGQLNFESNDSGTTYSQFQSRSTELFIKTLINIPMSFYTNNVERMRIDSSGNLLVGKTDQTANVAGTEIEGSGTIVSTRDNNTNMFLNRKTSDGNLIEFRKDNTVVGSIGTSNGDLYIGTGDTGLRFHDGDNSIYSVNATTGAKINGAIDLGEPAGRFKDLYLSGSVLTSNIYGQNDGNTGIQFEGSDLITIHTGGAERMRIDSSGNVLVGKTSTGAEFPGITLGSSGYASFTRDSNISLFLNRETNDGTIVEFRKDNTAVGSIGNDNTTDLVITATDDMFFNVAGASNNILQLFGGSGANSQAKFDGHVYPLTDNANDLGNTSERFRHIYISGGIHLGGTGSANELDDYEEGSYQPTITGGTSGSMTTGDSATYLLYTKIGNTVHVQGQIHITASTAVGTILVSLPFASGDTSGLAERSAGGGVIFDSSSGGVTYPTNTVDCCPYVTTGASVFQFRVSISGGGAASLSDTHIGASDRFAVSITYKTA